MNIPDLEIRLTRAEAHLALALTPFSGVADTLAAFEAVSVAQRALASEKHEEYAEPFEIGFVPEAAVSEAVLLQTEKAAFLTFSAMRQMADGKRERAGHAILELRGCALTKFGCPNDEALPGHPLYKKGLSGYGIFEVKNSSWVRSVTEQNRVAFPNTGDSSDRHFIIVFHDSTFECIAGEIHASLSSKPYLAIFEQIRDAIL